MAEGAGIATAQEPTATTAAGDRGAAFRDLAKRHLDRSYGLARAILDDPAEAEDATQDAFEAAWRSWPSLRDTTRFEAWFDRIVVNTCRNRLRRRRRIEFVHEIPPNLASDAGSAFTSAADRDELGAALRRLTPDHRIAVAMRFFLDLPVDEIARRTGTRPGTVKSRLHNAMAAMRTTLDGFEAEGAR